MSGAADPSTKPFRFGCSETANGQHEMGIWSRKRRTVLFVLLDPGPIRLSLIGRRREPPGPAADFPPHSAAHKKQGTKRNGIHHPGGSRQAQQG